MRRVAAVFAVLSLFWPVLPAQARDKGVAGQFDYYILSLSWSPSWCAKSGRGDGEQCGGARRYGFVLHGLWPQYAKGGYPSECAVSQAVPSQVVEDTLPLMPSRRLIQHEWGRHGTCDGADVGAYFAKMRQAFERVRVPKPFQSPETPQTMSVDQVERLFVAANPGMDRRGIAVVCRGRQASEIRICLDRDLKFRACGRDVRPRCKGGAQFPAAR